MNQARPEEVNKSHYEIGYGKPPRHTQFKKNKSGNPRGRPKGSRNKLRGNEQTLNAYVLAESHRKIKVNENGKSVPMSVARVAIKSLNLKAAQGDMSAIKLLLQVLDRAESQKLQETAELIKTAVKFKQNHSRYIQQCKREGVFYDIPYPHPDHVQIDWDTYEVTINGPVDLRGHKRWKAMINKMVGMEVELGMPKDWMATLSEEERKRAEDFDDADITKKCLNHLYKLIPTDDPLYLEYAESFRPEWVDYYYYYGQEPYLEEDILLQPKNMNTSCAAAPRPSYAGSTDCEKRYQEHQQFEAFMRNKLAEMMGAAWYERHDRSTHVSCNIELDKMRYEYDVGTFDPDNYELEGFLRERLQDKNFLQVYMSWSPQQERQEQIRAYLEKNAL